jgi:hypothetical protein
MPDFEDWQRTSRTFSSLIAVVRHVFSLVDEGRRTVHVERRT